MDVRTPELCEPVVDATSPSGGLSDNASVVVTAKVGAGNTLFQRHFDQWSLPAGAPHHLEDCCPPEQLEGHHRGSAARLQRADAFSLQLATAGRLTHHDSNLVYS
jgi:hypothetical protein